MRGCFFCWKQVGTLFIGNKNKTQSLDIGKITAQTIELFYKVKATIITIYVIMILIFKHEKIL